MRKIGIITLNGYVNYGNRLQNYALQEAIGSLGFSVETIRVSAGQKSPNIKNKLITRLKGIKADTVKHTLFNIGLMIYQVMYRKRIKSNNVKRTQVFKDFTADYIFETDYEISEHQIPSNLDERFDCFVTGSDQVWNPNFPEVSAIHFLTFALPQKRVAFSPSFGVSQIPSKEAKNYKLWISGMSSISVREDAGAKIIKELTGREAPVLVDPTLMLTKEEWLSVAKETIDKPQAPYLLIYFLGEISKEYKKQIKKISKQENLEIIDIMDFKNKETCQIGPSEFIDYINSCNIFCTDSFHGAVFSILMQKPFVIYERIGSSLTMFSRIDTLLEKFELNSRRAKNIYTSKDVLDIDYSHTLPILKIEREKAFKYLADALNTGESGRYES